MQRYLKKHLYPFLEKKIVLLSGPRQVGKTTLAKSLNQNMAYYNYDIKKDLRVFKDQLWDREKELVIFDELHKMKKWKLWLKGLYDEGALDSQQMLVTGSARLEISKRLGDSLAGRFFSFRLNPIDLKELRGTGSVEKNYQNLLQLGGFPEPFLSNDLKFSKVWRRTHSDLILKQDILSLEGIRDIEGLELLTQLLAERVGSTISINSLAEDLDRDDKTIKKWLQILENFYLIFKVPPQTKNIARGLKKASKYYFYDIARIEGDESAKLENLVALSFKKEIEFLEDTQGQKSRLTFVRTRDGKEIDFLVEREKSNPLLVEVKLSDESISSNFALFKKFFPKADCLQLVKNLNRSFSSKAGIKVIPALSYLENLNFAVDEA